MMSMEVYVEINTKNLVQNNKFRKEEVRITRAVNTYVFDITRLCTCIYSNSPYNKGVNL